ncbi:MAG TPA: SPOR domain-containing protein [Desulfobacterales bacterium]|nr:SPOR domain-containing protein [Desulfobacterales bacterium]
MKWHHVIVVILCFLVAGCFSQFRGSESELQARNHMDRAVALEDASEYHQAAQEYSIVAERYPSTNYYKTAVWKAALLNIHPANSKIDYNAALYWLKVYLGLPLSPEDKESAALYVAMLEHINVLESILSAFAAEKENLQAVAQKQSSDLVTVTQRLSQLEADLTQAQAELIKMKEVDVRMHRSRVDGGDIQPGEQVPKTAEGNKGEVRTPYANGHGAPPGPQDFFPYVIQVSSYANREESIQAALRSRKKGYSGFISYAHIPEKGDWYRVFVGFYRTFEAAQRAAFEMKKQDYLHAFVVKMPFAVQIGIFSSDKELKELEANLRSKGYLVYRLPDRISPNKIRLLEGAFPSEAAASEIAKALQKEDFEPKVVQR